MPIIPEVELREETTTTTTEPLWKRELREKKLKNKIAGKHPKLGVPC